jgi:hypothetical protein
MSFSSNAIASLEGKP